MEELSKDQGYNNYRPGDELMENGSVISLPPSAGESACYNNIYYARRDGLPQIAVLNRQYDGVSKEIYLVTDPIFFL